MRSLLVGLCLVAVASAYVKVSTNYHEEIGIPLATSIKEAEEKILDGQSGPSWASRIVGGSVAPPNAYPYLVGLVITFWDNPGTSACGAVLLNTNRLITAAHCYDVRGFWVRQFVAVLGSHFLFSGGTRITTNQVVVHPQWFPDFLNNDVAIVYLPTNVVFSSTIQPVSLPHNNLWETFEGNWGVASGYGKTSDAQEGISLSSVVSHVTVQVISTARCRAIYGPNFVQESTLCTDGFGGIGICSGDSGGPLVVNRNGQNILIGISSFVPQAGCELGHPSAFARVTSFYDFIMQHMW